MNSLGWLVLLGVGYYLYTHGGLPVLGQRPQLDTTIQQRLPGGVTIGLPIPAGWRVYRLADGSQVVIQAGAATAPGGWVQAVHNGQVIWFNEQTGQLQGAL